MSAALHKPQYLVRVGKQSPIRWDGVSLLKLGHKTPILLEARGKDFWVRDFGAPVSEIHPLQKVKVDHPVKLSDHRSLTVTELKPIAAIDLARVQSVGRIPIPTKTKLEADDRIFFMHLKRFGSGFAALFLIVMGVKLFEPEVKSTSELIPQKYAKIILTKPKSQQLSKGGSSPSQAQTKGVARAFQSKTVQKSMAAILKGGLSKYSIMSTGRAVQALTQSMNNSKNAAGLALADKANGMMAGSKVGQTQIGSEAGLGSGSGVNVKGQGLGQFEIGLNTTEASVDEGLTKEEVAKVIHAHMNEIRYCYESAIMKDPNISGKLLVDFKINAQGLVPQAGVSEASLRDQRVTQCLLGKLKTWKFPQPRGGVSVAVSYPFIFKSLSR